MPPGRRRQDRGHRRQREHEGRPTGAADGRRQECERGRREDGRRPGDERPEALPRRERRCLAGHVLLPCVDVGQADHAVDEVPAAPVDLDPTADREEREHAGEEEREGLARPLLPPRPDGQQPERGVGREPVVRQPESRGRGGREDRHRPRRQHDPRQLGRRAPRPPPDQVEDGRQRRDRPRRGPERGDAQELEEAEPDVLVGEVALAQHVEDVGVDERVPDEPVRAGLDDHVPAEGQYDPGEDPGRGQPAREGTEAPRERHPRRQRDDRRHRPQRILGEPGRAEGGEPADDPRAPPPLEPGQREREAPGKRRHEERLRPDVARVHEEPDRGEEDEARHDAVAPAEQARAEPRRGGDSRHGRHRRHRARGRLGAAKDGEGERDQPVQERRLVDVADAVQTEIERARHRAELPGDLRVHALARIVERHAPEAHEQRRRRGHRDHGPEQELHRAISSARRGRRRRRCRRCRPSGPA